MILIPIILLGLAALLGFTLLMYVLGGKDTPKAITLLHGLFAFSGIVALILLALYSPYKLWLSLGIFVVAALGGFYLLFKDLTDRIPKPVAVIHGLLALAGFVVLLVSVFNF
jgi:hypothetical protein